MEWIRQPAGSSDRQRACSRTWASLHRLNVQKCANSNLLNLKQARRIVGYTYVHIYIYMYVSP